MPHTPPPRSYKARNLPPQPPDGRVPLLIRRDRPPNPVPGPPAVGSPTPDTWFPWANTVSHFSTTPARADLDLLLEIATLADFGIPTFPHSPDLDVADLPAALRRLAGCALLTRLADNSYWPGVHEPTAESIASQPLLDAVCLALWDASKFPPGSITVSGPHNFTEIQPGGFWNVAPAAIASFLDISPIELARASRTLHDDGWLAMRGDHSWGFTERTMHYHGPGTPSPWSPFNRFLPPAHNRA